MKKQTNIFINRTFQQVLRQHTYSRVPNKRTGRLLENLKKSHLYALIQTYTFINFYQKVPPIRLFPPILLLFLYSHCPILLPFKTFLFILTLDDLRSHFEATIGNLNQKLINCKRIFYWNSKQTLLYPIECYQKIQPILLFRPIRLLIFSKKSHLYVYFHLYFYYFLKKFPAYTFIWNRRLFGSLE